MDAIVGPVGTDRSMTMKPAEALPHAYKLTARVRAVILAAMFTLVVGLPTSASAVEPEPIDRAKQALSKQMDAVRVPGAAFVVVDAAGETAVEGLGTTGDGRQVTATTPFVIGSTSKSFTALAVMQLVDDGLVDLDAPVRRYVPEFRLARGSATDSITVRHVLQQTSGLPEIAGGPVVKSAKDGSALDAVRELRDTRLAGPPGRTWHYSNANYVLAGLVVERASKMPYATYVERRIFAPLGMDRSSTSIRDARRDGVARGHRLWFGAMVSTGPAFRPGLLAAGYLVSTAQDMGRYLRMYLRGGLADDGRRVVSTRGLKTMTAPGPKAHLGPWAGEVSVHYAMGWFVGGPWQEPALLHPGNSPDSSAMITLLPNKGMAVATVMNLSHELPVPGNPAAPDRISRNVVDAILGEPVDTGPSTTGFYVVFDLIALLLVGAALWGLWRAVKTLRRGGPPRRRLLATLGVVVRVMAIALLLLIPVAAGYGWAGARAWAPDLTLVLATLVAVLIPVTALRLMTLLRHADRLDTGKEESA